MDKEPFEPKDEQAKTPEPELGSRFKELLESYLDGSITAEEYEKLVSDTVNEEKENQS